MSVEQVAVERRARIVMLVRVLDVTEAEAMTLRTNLHRCAGVIYADVDASSGFTEVEYQSPCSAERVLLVLRSTGKPVLTDPVCCWRAPTLGGMDVSLEDVT